MMLHAIGMNFAFSSACTNNLYTLFVSPSWPVPFSTILRPIHFQISEYGHDSQWGSLQYSLAIRHWFTIVSIPLLPCTTEMNLH